MLSRMTIAETSAPDLVPVLVMPFGTLLACIVLSLAVYIVWGRLKRT